VHSVSDIKQYRADYVCGCRFHRGQQSGEVIYDVLPESVDIRESALTMNLGIRGRAEILPVEMQFLTDNIFRMKIKSTETARRRYEIPVGDVLLSEPRPQR